MKLYQFPLSPNCQKVVALAFEVGIPLETVRVNVFKGELRTPELGKKNPNRLVPILEDGEVVLWESNAMLGYIAARADRPDLAPLTPRERADIDRWLYWQASHFGPALRKVAFERVVKKLAGLGAPDEAVVAQGVEEFHTFAGVLDQCLAGKEYVCHTLSIADFGLIPYAAATEICGLDLSRYAHARTWLGRMLERESVRRMLAYAREAQ